MQGHDEGLVDDAAAAAAADGRCKELFMCCGHLLL